MVAAVVVASGPATTPLLWFGLLLFDFCESRSRDLGTVRPMKDLAAFFNRSANNMVFGLALGTEFRSSAAATAAMGRVSLVACRSLMAKGPCTIALVRAVVAVVVVAVVVIAVVVVAVVGMVVGGGVVVVEPDRACNREVRSRGGCCSCRRLMPSLRCNCRGSDGSTGCFRADKDG